MTARRYRYLLAALFITLVTASFFITDFAYAAVIILFGIFPFVLFHAYFVSSGSYENSLVFAEKSVVVDKGCFSVVLLGGDVFSYDLRDIKYRMFASGGYIFEINGKILLNIPLKAFKNKEDINKFQNILLTQIKRD